MDELKNIFYPDVLGVILGMFIDDEKHYMSGEFDKIKKMCAFANEYKHHDYIIWVIVNNKHMEHIERRGLIFCHIHDDFDGYCQCKTMHSLSPYNSCIIESLTDGYRPVKFKSQFELKLDAVPQAPVSRHKVRRNERYTKPVYHRKNEKYRRLLKY